MKKLLFKRANLSDVDGCFMFAFTVRRLFSMIFVLWCVITATFFLIRFAPGGPFDKERKLPPTIEKQLLAKYRLDGPLSQQYRDYLFDVARGDLRMSLKYRNRTVNEILAQSLPVSAQLGAIALCIATFGGVWLGAIAALRQRTAVDTSAMFAALLAISLPTFVTGPLLVLLFSLKWQLLPVGGWGSLPQVILPAITLAGPYTAYIARLMRTSMLEVLGQDFIRTARAKGLAEGAIAYRHAAKVAILPVVSFLGPLAANLLTGSIVVETIFNIPGCGGFFVNSILNRDHFLLSGAVIVYCALLLGMNFLVDLCYGYLDKRIQIDG